MSHLPTCSYCGAEVTVHGQLPCACHKAGPPVRIEKFGPNPELTRHLPGAPAPDEEPDEADETELLACIRELRAKLVVYEETDRGSCQVIARQAKQIEELRAKLREATADFDELYESSGREALVARIDELLDERRCHLSNATKWAGAAIEWALETEAKLAEAEQWRALECKEKQAAVLRAEAAEASLARFSGVLSARKL
jgi:hypothetical protein